MTIAKTTFAILGSLTLATMLAAPASASWVHAHPRQTQVLARSHHQIARINEQRREGEITGAQARALRAGTRAIAYNTLANAQANGGYITRAEQRQANWQLNAQSRAIGR